MSEIKVNKIQSLSGTNGPVVSGITTMASSGAMSLPRGDTAYRGGRGRGCLYGGETPGPTNVNTISYITIATLGNANDFGDLTVARRGYTDTKIASSTRGVVAGGFIGPAVSTVSNVIDYFTISSTGNAFDFGDLPKTAYQFTATSDRTRGLFAGGYAPNNNTIVDEIRYVTIASTGDAVDFGTLTEPRRGYGNVNSPTRGIFAGGTFPNATKKNVIDFVTISTKGKATDFGDLSANRDQLAGVSNATRGVFVGGRQPGTTNVMEYITMASLGDTIDFGDLNGADQQHGGMSSPTRGVVTGNGGYSTDIAYLTITTLGDAADFGDNTVATANGSALSDSHGGLG